MNQGSLRIFRLTLACAALALAACASNPPAPVEERSSGDAAPRETERAAPRPSEVVTETYRVERGDTLYAIAFKRGVDFRDLAAWNDIAPPYRILIGQELRLHPRATSAPPAVAVAAVPNRSSPPPPAALAERPAKPQPSMFENVQPATAAVDATDRAAAPAPVSKPAASPPVTAPAAPKPVAEAAAAKPVAEPPPDAVKPVIAAAPRSDEHVAELNAGGVHWRWPGDGKLVGTFIAGDQTKQGIDIAGRAGDPVQAAADGEVVYSGNGLLGYGELIIVKHNANFLSAYGHNRSRLVKEGEKVKAGQQIAEMGSSASAREELHFEIRKNGKPVNPLDYLPVR